MMKKIKSILMICLLFAFSIIGLVSALTKSSYASSSGNCAEDCGCFGGSVSCCILPNGAICLGDST